MTTITTLQEAIGAVVALRDFTWTGHPRYNAPYASVAEVCDALDDLVQFYRTLAAAAGQSQGAIPHGAKRS